MSLTAQLAKRLPFAQNILTEELAQTPIHLSTLFRLLVMRIPKGARLYVVVHGIGLHGDHEEACRVIRLLESIEMKLRTGCVGRTDRLIFKVVFAGPGADWAEKVWRGVEGGDGV